MDTLHFFVPGLAITSGSKKSFYNKKTGKTIFAPDNPKQKDWQAAVKWFATQEFAGPELWDGPICMSMAFMRVRPKGHYGTGRNAGKLKDWAKHKKPTGKPDLLKLGRAVEDAMSGVVYVDDSQIVEEHLRKAYGDKPGVYITIKKTE